MPSNIEQSIYGLTHTSEYADPVGTMSLRERVEGFIASHFAEEVSKRRREELRDTLLEDAKNLGHKTDKGGNRLLVGEHLVLRERRVASMPDEKKLIGLLERKGIAVEAAFDRVTVLQPNPSKVNDLVENGTISAAEAETLYRESFALIVRPSGETADLLNEAIPASLRETKSRK